MLIIRGGEVKIDDPVLVNVFGFSYQRSERLGDWIAGLIEDRAKYRFNSVAEMRRLFLDRNIRSPLQPIFPYPAAPLGTYIIMTGSRAADERAANNNLRLYRTPDGYTWHHCEGIQRVANAWRCHMMLIQSQYHNSKRHMGGVHEYELMTGINYH